MLDNTDNISSSTSFILYTQYDFKKDVLLKLLNGKTIESLKPSIEKEILGKFLKGESIRNLSRDYGVDRELLTQGLRRLFAENEEELKLFDKVLEHNKATSRKVEDKTLEVAVEQIVFGQRTIKDVSEELKMDKETFRYKMMNALNKNKRLLIAYIDKESKRRPDYSFINFRALLLEMIKSGKTQSEIGNEYGIPARRISREVDKLTKEDEPLKDACKMQAEMSWRRLKENELTALEIRTLKRALDFYENIDVGPIILEDAKTHQELEEEKMNKILELADSVEGTNAEKAKAAGVSVSTLRRIKIKRQTYPNSLKEDRDREDD